MGRLASITVGGMRVPAPPVELAGNEAGVGTAADRAGAIGGALLRRFVVTIDFRRERLYLRDSGATDSMDVDMSGAWFIASADNLRTIVADHVEEDSPAAAAGLRPGDIVLELDGRTAPDLTLWELQEMLQINPGRRVPMVVRRGGETLRLELVLRRRV